MATHFNIPAWNIPLTEVAMDYSPGRAKELNTTEHLSTSTSDEKPVGNHTVYMRYDLNYMTFWKKQN